MRDLSAFKAAQQHIREQAELIDKARDAIIVCTLEGRVTSWNHGAERIFGWRAAEAVGRLKTELLGADIQDAAESLAMESGQDEWHGEVQTQDRLGRPLIVDKRVTMIRDDAGQPRARLMIATDITARKQIEEQFLRAQRLESLGMLAAGIAHDLNNVLSPILMGVPLLREGVRKPGDRRILDNLEKSAERGAALVRQILGFAHGIGGDAQVVHVKTIVRDLAAFIRQTFPKRVRFEEIQAPKLWPVRANPTHLHQVLLNLCVNARDAMPGGGRLRLAAENRVLDAATASSIDGAQPGPYLVLSVEDTGMGISAGALEKIWEPFFTTKETGKGTGLGLSTVRGIVLGHKGFITVETTEGRGAAFRVFLPALTTDVGDAAAPLPHLSAPGRGELILVVDDEANVRDITMAILTHYGYRVLGAGDGAEAATLLAARSSEVRLVVTDLQMPHLDGVALAGVVQRLNPAIKVIAVSGMESNRTLRSAMKYAAAFLSKPFKA
jgi:PAS domain S-box-containing protein